MPDPKTLSTRLQHIEQQILIWALLKPTDKKPPRVIREARKYLRSEQRRLRKILGIRGPLPKVPVPPPTVPVPARPGPAVRPAAARGAPAAKQAPAKQIPAKTVPAKPVPAVAGAKGKPVKRDARGAKRRA